MDKTKKICIILLFGIFFLFSSQKESFAVSNQHYADGADGFFCGYMPKPGFYLINYSYFYTSSTLHNDSGEEEAHLDFDLNVLAVAPRLIYEFPFKVFGLNYGIHITQPFYYTDLTIKSYGYTLADGYDKNMGDTIFSPLVVGAHHGPLHWIFSFDFVAPTGHYDDKDIVTTIVSKDYWSFQPNLSLTLLIKNNIDISAKFLFEFHSKTSTYDFLSRQELSYKPGATLHIDYAVGFPVTEKIRFGITGFYYQQLEADELAGMDVHNSKASGFALGPGIEILIGKWIFSFKEHLEIFSKNSTKGAVSWFNIYYSF